MYLNDVVANCSKTGISKSKETPPIKKANNGRVINKPKEIEKQILNQIMLAEF